MDSPVSSFMNTEFTLLDLIVERISLQLLKKKNLRSVPVLDSNDRVVDLLALDELISNGVVENPVVSWRAAKVLVLCPVLKIVQSLC